MPINLVFLRGKSLFHTWMMFRHVVVVVGTGGYISVGATSGTPLAPANW